MDNKPENIDGFYLLYGYSKIVVSNRHKSQSGSG